MSPRIPFLDSLRGAALLLMAVYHFCFDLSLFGAATIDFRAPIWLVFRAVIVTLFVGIAGVGFSLAGGVRGLRLLRLGICAALVSLGTARVFPEAWVFFGILHFLFVASLVGPFLARAPRVCLLAGLCLTALPFFFRSFLFETPLLRITGLSPVLPRTVDFVPLLPWLGVTLMGIFVGSWLKGRTFGRSGWLGFLGRHALFFYMTHQAALLPLAWGISRALR